MKCGDYRAWMARAIRNDLPEGWPVEDYQGHFVFCHRCRLLLSLNEVVETIGNLAAREPASPEDEAVWRAVREEVAGRENGNTNVTQMLGVMILILLVFLAMEIGVPGRPSASEHAAASASVAP